jgi:acetyltransferase EpsM
MEVYGSVMTHPITIPLINPNEPEALLAELLISAGQFVQAGDLVCSLETTKSTADVLAEASGYLVGLRFEAGQTVRAGEVLAYLADTPDWTPPVPQDEDLVGDAQKGSGAVPPADVRITQPALELARRHGLDLDGLPRGFLVTEAAVQAMLASAQHEPQAGIAGDFDPTALFIYGAGGHGMSLLELVRAQGIYRVVGFLDDGVSPGERVLDVPVFGGEERLSELYHQGVRLAVNAVGGIGDLAVRRRVFERILAAGFGCPAVVHPSAVLEPSASLAAGVQVFPLAYVGSQVRAGYGTIINTGAIVSHECVLGDLINISPGAILAGGVQVGEGTLVGMGATINLQVKVGKGARLGNGATVKADVPDGGIVPAGSVWPRD